jgi:hypothetical protein
MHDDLAVLTEKELDKLVKDAGRALSVAHKTFADRIIQGASQLKAATDAGYKERAAKTQSSRLIRRKDVLTYVNFRKEQQRRVADITMESMVRRHREVLEMAIIDRDWAAYTRITAEISKLLDFYPAQKTVGKLEHTGSIEHTGAVGINTNYMSNEVLQEIFELKRKEAAHETGSSKVH